MLLRRTAMLAAIALAAAACGDDAGTDPSNGLSTTQRIRLASKFSALAERLASSGGAAGAEASLAASFAALGIIAGAEVTSVTTAANGFPSITARFPDGPALSVADVPYSVLAIEYTDAEAPADAFRAVIAFRDTTDFALGYGSGTAAMNFSATATNAYGFIWRTPNSLWRATGGGMTAARASTGGVCDNWQPSQAEGATCHKGTFNASLNISASAPAQGTSATGSPTVSFGSATVGGIVIAQ